MMAALSRSSCL